MFGKSEKLDGAWEERGVYGPRIEIAGKRLTVFWRNSPVLETTFTTAARDGATELIPKKRGLRYRNAVTDYAELTGLVFNDGALTVTEYFPITGESKTVLHRTENSRFGNYDFADERFGELAGTWKDGNGYVTLVFKGGKLEINGRKVSVRLLKPKGDCSPYAALRIADSDASVSGWDGMSDFVYDHGVITARIDVCDAPSVTVTFTRV